MPVDKLQQFPLLKITCSSASWGVTPNCCTRLSRAFRGFFSVLFLLKGGGGWRGVVFLWKWCELHFWAVRCKWRNDKKCMTWNIIHVSPYQLVFRISSINSINCLSSVIHLDAGDYHGRQPQEASSSRLPPRPTDQVTVGHAGEGEDLVVSRNENKNAMGNGKIWWTCRKRSAMKFGIRELMWQHTHSIHVWYVYLCLWWM